MNLARQASTKPPRPSNDSLGTAFKRTHAPLPKLSDISDKPEERYFRASLNAFSRKVDRRN